MAKYDPISTLFSKIKLYYNVFVPINDNYVFLNSQIGSKGHLRVIELIKNQIGHKSTCDKHALTMNLGKNY